ncbi:MAG: helix-turn-helix transcriptional regulator [Clostridia bacterium]
MNLKLLRKRAGLTQKELSELSGIGRPLIARYEVGTRMPRIDKAVRLAKVLDVSLDELIGDDLPTR